VRFKPVTAKLTSLEDILKAEELEPVFRTHLFDYLAERAAFTESDVTPFHRGSGISPRVSELIRSRHALLGWYKSDSRIHTYEDVLTKVLFAALKAKKEQNPEKYNPLITQVTRLIALTHDSIILPTYSRRLDKTTKTAAAGGGIYDVKILLPDGKTSLDIIAKQFSDEEAFNTEVIAEEETGDGVLAIDAWNKIKYEFKKGGSTLADVLIPDNGSTAFDLLLKISDAVIERLDVSGRKTESFDVVRDTPQRVYDWLCDRLRGKKQYIGKRFIVPEVTDFTYDFFERWVFRLSPDIERELNSNGKIHRKALRKYSALDSLYQVLQRDFEPLFQRQKRQLMNCDINPGNILFGPAGKINFCDAENTRVDLVQKAIYDITRESGIGLEYELRLADRFNRQLDTSVDDATFRRIYVLRRVLEDCIFTKNIEYSQDPIRADTPEKKAFFESCALYYFNRSLRLAADPESGLGNTDFVDAIIASVDLMGKKDRLYLVSDEEFESLEELVIDSRKPEKPSDPLSDLRSILRTELAATKGAIEINRGYSGESTVKSKLATGAGIGLAVVLVIGGLAFLNECRNTTKDNSYPPTEAQYLDLSTEALNEVDIGIDGVELIESTACCTDWASVYHLWDYFPYWSPEQARRDLDYGAVEIGTPRRLHSAILRSNAYNSFDAGDLPGDARTDHYLVPLDFLETHTLNGEHIIPRQLCYPQLTQFNEFETDFFISSRYLKYCLLRNDGNVVNTIADYYVGGGEDLREAMIRAGTDNYFDSTVHETNEAGDEISYTLPGYRHQLADDLVTLIDTAIYFYLHTGETGISFEDERIF
jgi:hypothetical protein